MTMLSMSITRRTSALLIAAGVVVMAAGIARSQGVKFSLGVKSISGNAFWMLPHGAVQTSAVWSKPGWTLLEDKPIDVCWERLSDSTPALREAVRAAVGKTWALYGMVSFRGWKQCAPGAEGIRIGIGKEESLTVYLGQHLDGVPNGMLLRMDFTPFDFCKGRNEFCVTATAVHEFGHALGFAHEQNRSDAPVWCNREHASGTLPDKTLTIYDPQSIMNYCNKTWQNDGLLSPKDIQSVTTIYGGRA